MVGFNFHCDGRLQLLPQYLGFRLSGLRLRADFEGFLGARFEAYDLGVTDFNQKTVERLAKLPFFLGGGGGSPAAPSFEFRGSRLGLRTSLLCV